MGDSTLSDLVWWSDVFADVDAGLQIAGPILEAAFSEDANAISALINNLYDAIISINKTFTEAIGRLQNNETLDIKYVPKPSEIQPLVDKTASGAMQWVQVIWNAVTSGLRTLSDQVIKWQWFQIGLDNFLSNSEAFQTEIANFVSALEKK